MAGARAHRRADQGGDQQRRDDAHAENADRRQRLRQERRCDEGDREADRRRGPVARRDRDDRSGADREDDRDQREVHGLALGSGSSDDPGDDPDVSSGWLGVGRIPNVSKGQ